MERTMTFSFSEVWAGYASLHVLGSSILSCKIHVDWMFWRTLVCFPRTVASDFGRFKETSFSVRPGQ
eukprot:4030226-Ditylum_brightwellii.AAC.1